MSEWANDENGLFSSYKLPNFRFSAKRIGSIRKWQSKRFHAHQCIIDDVCPPIANVVLFSIQRCLRCQEDWYRYSIAQHAHCRFCWLIVHWIQFNAPCHSAGSYTDVWMSTKCGQTIWFTSWQRPACSFAYSLWSQTHRFMSVDEVRINVKCQQIFRSWQQFIVGRRRVKTTNCVGFSSYRDPSLLIPIYLAGLLLLPITSTSGIRTALHVLFDSSMSDVTVCLSAHRSHDKFLIAVRVQNPRSVSNEERNSNWISGPDFGWFLWRYSKRLDHHFCHSEMQLHSHKDKTYSLNDSDFALDSYLLLIGVSHSHLFTVSHCHLVT